MSTEQNRKVADELFARLSAGDIPGALATMTDDATWVAAGRREDLPAAGTYDKRRLERPHLQPALPLLHRVPRGEDLRGAGVPRYAACVQRVVCKDLAGGRGAI